MSDFPAVADGITRRNRESLFTAESKNQRFFQHDENRVAIHGLFLASKAAIGTCDGNCHEQLVAREAWHNGTLLEASLDWAHRLRNSLPSKKYPDERVSVSQISMSSLSPILPTMPMI